MILPEFLTRGPMGEIHLTGHRIDLYHVLSLYEEGHTAERIHAEYPTLPLALVENVLAFCHDNEAGVGAYMREVKARIARQRADYRPGPGILRLRELKEAGTQPSS